MRGRAAETDLNWERRVEELEAFYWRILSISEHETNLQE